MTQSNLELGGTLGYIHLVLADRQIKFLTSTKQAVEDSHAT